MNAPHQSKSLLHLLHGCIILRVRLDHVAELRKEPPEPPEGHDGFETDVWQILPSADPTKPTELKAVGRCYRMGDAIELAKQAEAGLATPPDPAPTDSAGPKTETEVLLEKSTDAEAAVPHN